MILAATDPAGMIADGRWPLLLVVLLAAVAAGTINTVVGSGTLLTFPALLAVGLPPVMANVTNNVGLVLGSVSGTWGYRHELRGQYRRLAWLAMFSATGGLLGAVALLRLPGAIFETVVPVLVGLAVVLVLVGPRLTAWAERRAGERAGGRQTETSRAARMALGGGVFGAGVYGGYFGAAQGVLLIGILDIGLTETLQRINALKNALATIVNALATMVFVVAAPAQVNWALAAVVAPGALLGGVLGARYGRRLPAPVLRGVVVVVGIVAIAILVLT